VSRFTNSKIQLLCWGPQFHRSCRINYSTAAVFIVHTAVVLTYYVDMPLNTTRTKPDFEPFQFAYLEMCHRKGQDVASRTFPMCRLSTATREPRRLPWDKWLDLLPVSFHYQFILYSTVHMMCFTTVLSLFIWLKSLLQCFKSSTQYSVFTIPNDLESHHYPSCPSQPPVDVKLELG